MVKKKVRIRLALPLCFMLLGYVAMLSFYSGKKVHLSIDDVSCCVQRLTKDSLKCESVFDEPFLHKLQIFHDVLGAKFTLYIYEQDGDYTINKFPGKFKGEFIRNNDWLRFGFHAISPESEKTGDADFFQAYNVVDSNLVAKWGGKSNTLRLHYFYASKNEIRFLKNKGITTLLSADDDRISYSLSASENQKLISQGSLKCEGIDIVHTDMRVERGNLFIKLWSHRNDGELVVFTHEWALNSSKWNRVKFLALIAVLKILNCNFIID